MHSLTYIEWDGTIKLCISECLNRHLTGLSKPYNLVRALCGIAFEASLSVYCMPQPHIDMPKSSRLLVVFVKYSKIVLAIVLSDNHLFV